jgi:hypothetical protein
MKKISEVFNLNEPIGYPVSWSDDQVRAGNKAIRNVDQLADALQNILDAVGKQSHALSAENFLAVDAGLLALHNYRGEE